MSYFGLQINTLLYCPVNVLLNFSLTLDPSNKVIGIIVLIN